MLRLSENVELIRVAVAIRHDVEEATERRVRKIVHALEMRRFRRWNATLGRRADGRTIRPIPAPGRRFRFAPILDATQKALLIARVRAAVVSEPSCESCGEAHAEAAVVYNPGTSTGYWPATLCGSCQRSLNSAPVQRDILQSEVERAERAAGWDASA